MTLNELIAGEPSLSDAITTGNDGTIVEWLNTPSIPASRPIKINAFVGNLYNSGAFVAIITAAATGNQTASMAVTLIEKSKALGIERIDLTLPVNQSMIATLISENIITQAQADSVASLADTLISPAEFAGLNPVSLIDVAEWRLSNG